MFPMRTSTQYERLLTEEGNPSSFCVLTSRINLPFLSKVETKAYLYIIKVEKEIAKLSVFYFPIFKDWVYYVTWLGKEEFDLFLQVFVYADYYQYLIETKINYRSCVWKNQSAKF